MTINALIKASTSETVETQQFPALVEPKRGELCVPMIEFVQAYHQQGMLTSIHDWWVEHGCPTRILYGSHQHDDAVVISCDQSSISVYWSAQP